MKTKLSPIKLIQRMRCDFCEKTTSQTANHAGKGVKVFVCDHCKKTTWYIHHLYIDCDS